MTDPTRCDICLSPLVKAINDTTVYQYLLCLDCPKVFKDFNFDGMINPVV